MFCFVLFKGGVCGGHPFFIIYSTHLCNIIWWLGFLFLSLLYNNLKLYIMKIDLRKVKYHEDVSEETPCFSCEIWEDNKLIAYCSNEGHGGGNRINRANNGIPHEQAMKYDNLETEAEIFRLVWLDDDVKKLQTKNFVLYKDDKMYTVKFPHPISKLKKFSNFKSWLTKQVNNHRNGGYEVLNKNLGQI